jgi:PKD repeat protein
MSLAPPVLAGLNDGLVAYYPFDGNANDASGNGHDGTVNGATLTEDRYGNANRAYSFGVNNYIRVADDESLDITNEITMAAWIYRETHTSGWESIFTKGHTSSMNSPYALLIHQNTIELALNRKHLQGSVDIPANQWIHVAATWDGHEVKYYINGVQDPKVHQYSNALRITDEDLLIGSDPPGAPEWFNGKLDELRIYNRALSESEIQALSTNANFTTDKISGEPPLTVQFSDASAIDEPITSWAWDFDNDGTIDSTEQHPTYTYNEKGLYSVNLTVGADEYTITKNDFILVYDALLSLNTPVPNTLTEADEYHYYKIDLAPGNSIRLTLDDADDSGNIELYVAHNAFPSRTDYDYQSTGGADPEIIIPIAEAGDWYVLVYGASGNYDITAHLIDIGINNIKPQYHGKAANVPLTITGIGFKDDTSVKLVADDGTEYSPISLSIDSLTQITAAFDLTTIPVGKYDIKIANQSGEYVMEKGFEVIEGDEAKLETNLVLPGALGRHAVATLYVEYKNTGNIAMPAPLLILRSADEDDSDKPILTLDYSRVVQNLWTSTMPEGASHAVQFLADGDDDSPGVLQPGESGRMPVYYTGLLRPWDFSDNNVEFEIRIIEADNETSLNWDTRKDELKPDNMSEDAWNILFSNLSNAMGNTWGDYVTILSENAVYLKQHGNQTVSDTEKLFQFELNQAIGYNPLSSMADDIDIVVEAPGIPLSFSRYFSSSLKNRHQDSPLGKGWTHSWQTHLEEDENGNVTIFDLNSSLKYQPDSRGGYFSPKGDYSKLSKADGLFTLKYSDGTIEKFTADGKLDYIEDLNGNRITAEYTEDLLTRLSHNAGQFLQLSYNGTHIETITDHTGTLYLATMLNSWHR